jgi:hypothetical protein
MWKDARCILKPEGTLSRFSLAFKSFFAILFGDGLPDQVAKAFGYVKEADVKPPPAPTPEVRTSDGALQILGILQRDARLVDFLMEDISGYSDEQVGAAVRSMHEQSRATLSRYVTLSPVVDGVEGTNTRIDTRDPNSVKLLGNVPADGKARQGVLRHRGWRVDNVDLPKLPAGQNVAVLAPAEFEIE